MKARLYIALACGGMVSFALSAAAQAQDFTPKEKGTLILNGRITTVDPDAGDPILTAAGVDTGLDAVVSSHTMPTLGLTYFISDNVAVEVIAGTTKHTVRATNLPAAETWVLPPIVSLQYHFVPAERVSPYVGAGVNYMMFYDDENIAPFTDFSIDDGFGYALQAGVDVALRGRWSLNLDAKKVWFDTTARTTLAGPGPLHSEVNLDPWVLSAGLGYRF